MDEININIEETNFCTIVQNDVSDFTVNLENPTTNFCVEVQEGIGALPHTHPISDIIGLQSELDGLHTDVTNIENTLDLKADLIDGKVPSSQLPSFVDDVLEFSSLSAFPVTGENGKIYVALDTNLTYRWSGSTYAEISPSLALGETSTTAYRGDRGKIAYDHSRILFGNPHGTTLDNVTSSGNQTTNAIQVGSVFSGYYDINSSVLVADATGRIKWNSADGTYDMCLYNGVTLQAGQEQHFYGKAVGSITNGSPVQFAGSQGNHFLIKTAVASEINANPELFMGIATQSFTNNQFGYVTMFGNVRDLNTSAYSDGTLLYFDSVNGGLTTTKPSYPNARILVCAVTNSHTNQGSLFVRPEIQRYGKWNEIVNQPSTFTPSAHIHAISDVTNLQTSLDYKVDKVTGKGLSTEDYTTAEKTKLSGIQSGAEVNVNADWNATSGDAQILNKPSTFTPSAHTHAIADVTNLQTSLDGKIALTSLSASSPLSYNNGTGAFSIQQATSSQDGYISSTDWSTFNGKVSSQWTTSGSNIYYNGGNVGIGTTSPSAKLYVNNTASTSVPALQVASSGSLANQIVARFQINGVTNGFTMGQDASSNVYYLFDGGNVGIGTTSPNAKLQVEGQDIYLTGNTDNRIRFSNYGFTGNSMGAAIGYIYGTANTQEQGNIAFYTNPNFNGTGSLTERMRITSSGNVGIGTTSPSNKLHVLSSISDWGFRSENTKSLMVSSHGDGYGMAIESASNTSSIYLLKVAGGNGTSIGTNEYFRITGTGNVGIGTTSPATKLDVAGAITASGGFFNSDIRLKEITDYKYSVSDIKPITYTWKDKRDDKKHIGYSAQDVQKVMPDAVNEDAEGMLSINYVEILVAKIAELENRIKQLENGLE